MFTRALYENHSIIYFKCNKVGHEISECNMNRIGHTLFKHIWVPKGTLCANTYGPKKAWIPKSRK